MDNKLAIFCLAIIAASNANAGSGSLCKAIVLRDVAAIENPSSMLIKGEYDTSITQYRVNKSTGVSSFCSHGGYCYPTHVFVKGNKVEALRLTNCKIGKMDDYDDEEEFFYSVDVIRSKNTPDKLRLQDVGDRFSEMGLCSACADNVTQFYINKPSSRCGTLARQALEGNPIAEKTLLTYPAYCVFWRQ
jgi:hypothetical protein